ncbi:VanW family protein [Candidatus Gottesmanbacteria bacterium]|nr:VanW family protein [Candidatus Gottesmanbacteria bacterium]
MITGHLIALLAAALVATHAYAFPYFSGGSTVRTERSFSLGRRFTDPWVNKVFSDNILLTLARMDGNITKPTDIRWDEVTKPQTFSFSLAPGELFAFHEDVLDQYKGKPIKTMKSHFNYSDGFRSSGALFGDGVCHLASLLYWAAKSAGLEAEVPANHNFAPIPQVPREYGVSIYYMPGAPTANARQNLYITNSLADPVRFLFASDGQTLTIRVIQETGNLN